MQEILKTIGTDLATNVVWAVLCLLAVWLRNLSKKAAIVVLCAKSSV